MKIIYSLPQTEGEMFSIDGDPQYKIVNLMDTCPCNMNEGVCDKACCCDMDCLTDMLDINYYEKNKYCDPSSYISRRINSKLDYCDDYTKSLDDLYNPLVLAFKILKKGFCLYADHFKKNDDKKDQYDNNKNAIMNDNGEKEKEDFTKVFPVDQHNFGIGEKAFEMMNFNAPIALPSGLCLFNSYPIKKFEDYEVICSFRNTLDNNVNIKNSFSPQNKQQFTIKIYSIDSNTNTYQLITDEPDPSLFYFKKIEIIYYNDGTVPGISYYYENNVATEYQDLTFIVKFLSHSKDYKKSGNPGYIKGKPLLMIYNDNDGNHKFKEDAVFPISFDTSMTSTQWIYYNNYFDNKITFEDLIFYGYTKVNGDGDDYNLLRQYFSGNMLENDNYFVGKLGDANIKLKKDWEGISGLQNVDNNPYLLMGLYKTINTVNNAQFQIYKFGRLDEGAKLDGNQPYYYFITKFLKLKKIQTKWWYALPPGFFKLPRNTMYPFKVGTTNYQDSN